MATLTERGLIEESGRSRFGAVVYRTTPLFEKLFGLSGLDQLPDPHGSIPRRRTSASSASACCGRRAAGHLTAIRLSGMRLVKYLAHCGVASRRRAEELIAAADGFGSGARPSLDPARDVDESSGVEVDGRPVVPEPREVWIVNKPAGVVSTAREPGGARPWSSWSTRTGASTRSGASTRTPPA